MADVEVRADDGTTLFVRHVGEGRPVMLIAGLGGVGTFWNPVVERLGGRRLIVPDHRGTGRSGRPWGRYSIEVIAGDMERIAERLCLGPFDVVGHSTGGVIAQRLMLRGRVPVRAAVLGGTFARPDAHFHLLFRTRLAMLENAGAEASAALAHLLGYPPEWVRDNAEAVDEAVSRASAEDRRIAAARLRMLLDYCPNEDLGSIDVPTLVLGSEEDVIHPAYHQRALAEAIPGARLAMMAGGHFFPRVRPDDYASTVAAFLDEDH